MIPIYFFKTAWIIFSDTGASGYSALVALCPGQHNENIRLVCCWLLVRLQAFIDHQHYNVPYICCAASADLPECTRSDPQCWLEGSVCDISKRSCAHAAVPDIPNSSVNCSAATSIGANCAVVASKGFKCDSARVTCAFEFGFGVYKVQLLC